MIFFNDLSRINACSLILSILVFLVIIIYLYIILETFSLNKNN